MEKLKATGLSSKIFFGVMLATQNFSLPASATTNRKVCDPRVLTAVNPLYGPQLSVTREGVEAAINYVEPIRGDNISKAREALQNFKPSETPSAYKLPTSLKSKIQNDIEGPNKGFLLADAIESKLAQLPEPLRNEVILEIERFFALVQLTQRQSGRDVGAGVELEKSNASKIHATKAWENVLEALAIDTKNPTGAPVDGDLPGNIARLKRGEHLPTKILKNIFSNITREVADAYPTFFNPSPQEMYYRPGVQEFDLAVLKILIAKAQPLQAFFGVAKPNGYDAFVLASILDRGFAVTEALENSKTLARIFSLSPIFDFTTYLKKTIEFSQNTTLQLHPSRHWAWKWLQFAANASAEEAGESVASQLVDYPSTLNQWLSFVASSSPQKVVQDVYAQLSNDPTLFETLVVGLSETAHLSDFDENDAHEKVEALRTWIRHMHLPLNEKLKLATAVLVFRRGTEQVQRALDGELTPGTVIETFLFDRPQ